MAAHQQPSQHRLPRLVAIVLVCAGLLGSTLWLPCEAAFTTAITPDGTLGTSVTQSSNVFNINGGTIRGNNQFHSLSLLNVGTGDIASFNGPANIANILTRVTGGQSMIDGQLRSTITGANLYLMNPAGLIFGPNATLNVSGSFHVTTADYLRLTDGVPFTAKPDVVKDSLLTTSPVAAFGFLSNNPAPITIQGSALSVPESQTLSLVGGDITIAGATLSAPSGQINLVSVASAGEAILATAPTAPAFDISSFSTLGQITISGNSTLDASDMSGIGGGTVFIRAGQFTLDGSTINVNTLGDVDGAPVAVDLQVTNDILLTNDALINAATLGTGPLLGPQGTGRSGDVNTTASTMEIDQLAYTQTYTNSNGRAGDTTVNVRTLTLSNGGQLDSGFGSGAGQGGNIIVQGRQGAGSMADSVTITGTDPSGVYPSGPFSGTFTSGNAGDITVSAKAMTIDNGGFVYTVTYGTGNAGNITLNVGTLTTSVYNPFATSVKATIESESVGFYTPPGLADGKAGDITINASGPIILNNTSVVSNGCYCVPGFFFGTGQGGSITLTSAGPTSKIELNESALIAQVNDLPADMLTRRPAQITVTADTVSMTGNYPLSGGINSATYGSAPAADIAINVKTLRSFPGVADGFNAAGISSTTGSGVNSTNAGPAGNVIIKGPDPNNPNDAATLIDLNGGGIGTTSYGRSSGASAGNITITADTVVLTRMGFATNFRGDVVQTGGGIASETDGPAPAGNIILNVRTLLSNVTRDGTLTPATATDLIPMPQYIVDSDNLPAGTWVDQNVISSRSTGQFVSLPRNSDPHSPLAGAPGSVIIKGPDPSNPNDAATFVTLNNTLLLTTMSGGRSSTPPGQIKILADTLALTNGTQILADTSGAAPAGNITLNVGTLASNMQVHDGNLTPLHDAARVLIKSTSTGLGRAGTVAIQGLDSTDMVSTPATSVALNNTTVSTVAGNAVSSSAIPARITIIADAVDISNGTTITADTSGAAPAGDITVTATDTFSLAGGSSLLAGTESNGDGGRIVVSAPTLTMTDGAALDSSTAGKGRGGNIVLDIGNGNLTHGAEISSKSTSTGNAGDIHITAADRFVLRDSSVTTQATQADGGNITITAGNLVLLVDSEISTSVQGGAGNGGNIMIDPQFVILRHSEILANAFGGNGGNITIVAGLLLSSPDSVISASSALGVSGTITIDSAISDLSGSLAPLPSGFLKTGALFRSRCSARLAGETTSSFVIASKGGIPTEPGGTLISPLPSTNVRSARFSSSSDDVVLRVSPQFAGSSTALPPLGGTCSS